MADPLTNVLQTPSAAPMQATPTSNVGVGGSGGAPQGGLDPETLKKLMAQVTQGHRGITPGQPRPNAASPSLGAQLGMNVLNMFVPFVGGAVQKAVKQEREGQIVDVMNKLQVIDNELQMAQYVGNGDKKKEQEYLNQSPALHAIFNGKESKKFLKGMQKVFGQDLLSPEKQNTVFHEGMKRHISRTQAATKVKEAFERMVGHKQQQQAQGAQGAQQGQPQQGQPQQQPPPSNSEMVSRIPQRVTLPDPKQVQETAATLKDVIQAANDAIPKSDMQAYWRTFKNEHGGDEPKTADLEAHRNAIRLRPLDQRIEDAYDEFDQTGDKEALRSKLEVLHMGANALHADPHENITDIMTKAYRGDKDAQGRWAMYQKQQMSRAEAYGKGRAMYNLGVYLDKGGTPIVMSALDVINAAHQGEFYMPAGRLSADKIAAVQGLQKEAGPVGSPEYNTGALKGVFDNIGAFDNSKDRAIYAQIMRNADQNGMLNPPEFVKNIFDQALTGDLSPEGRKYAVAGRRLADIMGRLRVANSLPSTNRSMELTLALMPGPQTPDSGFAHDMLSQLNQTIENAIELPIYKGVVPQQKKQSFADYLNGLKNKNKGKP